MPHGGHCPHCRAVNPIDLNEWFRCSRCGLLFNLDGTVFVPESCMRCKGPVEWTGNYYDCKGCGRERFGPFPTSPGTRMGPEPVEGWAAYAVGAPHRGRSTVG